MYKLLIVDDEKDIRDGLTHIVDWQKMGFNVINSSLEDGKDAIEYLKENDVDVILTDIKMNNISGIELAKYVHENYPNVKVIILSGFREFELAQEAMRYGVKIYLSKPTNFKELNTQFKDLKKLLDNERNKSAELREQKLERINALKEQFFTDLTGGGISSKDELNRRIKLIGYKSVKTNNHCSIISLVIKDYKHFLHDIWKRGKNDLNTMMRSVYCGENEVFVFYLFHINENELNLCIIEQVYSDLDGFRVKSDNFLKNTTHSIETLLDVNIEVNKSSVFKGLDALVFDQTKAIIPIISDKSSIESSVSAKDIEILYEQRKLFLSYVVSMNIGGIRNIFDNILQKLVLVETHVVHEFVINLLVGMKNQLYHIDNKSFKILNEYRYADVFCQQSVQEIHIWVEKIFMALESYFEECGNQIEMKTIHSVKKYIKVHFSSDISLDDVAEHVNLNSAYLSRLFKQETNENFTGYLLKVRMEKAKELLISSHFKCNEICEQVGYNNPKYFCTIFKKYTGLTTSEFRTNNR